MSQSQTSRFSKIAANFLIGGQQYAIARQALFPGVFGFACLFSLFLLSKPLMFYIFRQLAAGDDPLRRQEFSQSWQSARTRANHRLMTAVWGAALFGEFVVCLLIANALPLSKAQMLGRVLSIGVPLVTGFWSFSHIRRLKNSAQQESIT